MSDARGTFRAAAPAWYVNRGSRGVSTLHTQASTRISPPWQTPVGEEPCPYIRPEPESTPYRYGIRFLAEGARIIFGYLGSAYLIGLLCAALYAAVTLGLWLITGSRAAGAFLLASAPVAVALILGVIAFQVVAADLRTVPGPGGETMERQGRDWPAFTLMARLAFFGLYASAVVGTLILGRSVGERIAGREMLVSVASTMALVGAMAITLPIVDYFNACTVGFSFVLASTC